MRKYKQYLTIACAALAPSLTFAQLSAQEMRDQVTGATKRPDSNTENGLTKEAAKWGVSLGTGYAVTSQLNQFTEEGALARLQKRYSQSEIKLIKIEAETAKLEFDVHRSLALKQRDLQERVRSAADEWNKIDGGLRTAYLDIVERDKSISARLRSVQDDITAEKANLLELSADRADRIASKETFIQFLEQEEASLLVEKDKITAAQTDAFHDTIRRHNALTDAQRELGLLEFRLEQNRTTPAMLQRELNSMKAKLARLDVLKAERDLVMTAMKPSGAVRSGIQEIQEKIRSRAYNGGIKAAARGIGFRLLQGATFVTLVATTQQAFDVLTGAQETGVLPDSLPDGVEIIRDGDFGWASNKPNDFSSNSLSQADATLIDENEDLGHHSRANRD